MIVRSLVRSAFSRIVVPLEGKLEIKKKKDPDLKALKKELEIQKQNRLNNPDAIYDEIPHREVYKKINTSIEAFFNKRSFSIQNFNFLLNVIAEQRKTEQIEKVLELMHSLNIPPTEETYNYIIRAWAIVGDLQKSQQIFEKYKKLFVPTKHTYNSMMMVYKTCGLCQKAEQLFLEMEQKGIVPDLPILTTLINSNHKSRNLRRCWELHKIVQKLGLKMDQPYIGMMMTVYASSHDAEKAIKLYEDHIKDAQQRPLLETVNAYLRALSSRADYSERAINYFFLLVSRGQFINKTTIMLALKACANLGHIKDATSIVKIMRQKGIEPDEFIYNSMFRCYAGGVSLPQISEDTADLFITDAWKLLDEVSKKRLVNVTILNSFMLIFIQALRTEEIDGLVLPLYKKYGITKNQYTYEQLMKFLKKKDDVVGIEKMWDAELKYLQEQKKAFLEKNNNNQYKLNSAMKRGEFLPTFDSICMHLESGIKLMDMDKVVESLRLIKQINRYPKFSHLKFLGELKDVPVQIKAELVQFQTRFGEVSNEKKGIPWKKKKKEHLDPQDKDK